ncbi:hypothetical protein BGZ83_006596 [Gryganskiella cystojenkinii]|nr:hypothetical protein BGZ83_006596 [Gryganskiella cystojenkinii]
MHYKVSSSSSVALVAVAAAVSFVTQTNALPQEPLMTIKSVATTTNSGLGATPTWSSKNLNAPLPRPIDDSAPSTDPIQESNVVSAPLTDPAPLSAAGADVGDKDKWGWGCGGWGGWGDWGGWSWPCWSGCWL